MEKYVITIAREYGSGGRGIAHRLAEALGIRYYDKTAESARHCSILPTKNLKINSCVNTESPKGHWFHSHILKTN